MKTRFLLPLATALLANCALAADVAPTAGHDAAEKHYAEDRKLCSDEPSSTTRMQCLRDARAEYDKAINAAGHARAGNARTCAGCGKVLSVRLVEKEGEGSATGMVAGGLAGALLGNQIGKGSSRDIATLAGAAGGAYAGKVIEQKVKTVKRWDAAVRFDNGDERTYSFDKDPGFGAGTEVKASGNSIVAR